MAESMDLEAIVTTIVATATRKMLLARQEFEPVDPTTNDMLEWESSQHKFAQIQELAGGYARIGTVGDGNCLLHSMLFATSPTYRTHNKAARSYIADRVRELVVARAEEVRDMADIAFANAGGSSALEESFEILEGRRQEINIELAPLVGRLFGINLLAVQIRRDMHMHPVCATYMGRDPDLPTVLVNYLGGGLDFGDAAEGFQEGGHYECIFAPTLVSAAASEAGGGGGGAGAGAKAGATARRAKSAAAAAARVMIDEAHTRYIFDDTHLASLLATFAAACAPSMNERAAAAAAAAATSGAAKKRTSSSGSKRAATHKRSSSNGKRATTRKSSSGSKKKSTSSH
jgi:hypothetical protein